MIHIIVYEQSFFLSMIFVPEARNAMKNNNGWFHAVPHPCGRALGEGGCKSQSLKGKHKAKLECTEGLREGEFNKKNFHVREKVFSKTTQYCCVQSINQFFLSLA